MTHIPVSSSNIASVGYDAVDKVLEVSFLNGSIYQYTDVAPRVYQEFLRRKRTGESIGVYFNGHVKGVYAFTKVG